MVIPPNFDGSAFAQKFTLAAGSFSVDCEGNLRCPLLPDLTDADIADCVSEPQPEYVTLRNAERARLWPTDKQLEALVEDALGRPEKKQALIVFENDLRARHPKPQNG